MGVAKKNGIQFLVKNIWGGVFKGNQNFKKFV